MLSTHISINQFIKMSGNILVRQSKQVKQTKGSTVHGASKLLVPHSAQALASADFKDFAPYPCICCGCLPSKAQKKRVYSLVYENKLESDEQLPMRAMALLHPRRLHQRRYQHRILQPSSLLCGHVPQAVLLHPVYMLRTSRHLRETSNILRLCRLSSLLW